ncbi:MAG: chitobiase/beta-hexosaminidase C-terminal domain-containing protein, partial [archaeon]
IYSSPFTITGTTNIKAKAYKTGYEPSATATFNYTINQSPQNIILSFNLQDVDSQTTIDNDFNSIIIRVPYATDVTQLMPLIEVEDYCTINPESGVIQDFTNPITYLVTSFSGQRSYIVKVVKNQPVIGVPQANISGGNYNTTQIIELTTETEGAVIRYTIDGSYPQLSSNIYEGPITVSSTTILKAKAFLYVGTELSYSQLESGENLRAVSDLVTTPLTWISSGLMSESYTITRKNNNEAKAEKKVISTQEMDK